MKNLIFTSILTLLMLMSTIMTQAQEKSKNTLFSIHEDVVKPSMISEYEAIGKELIAHLKKHKINGLKWITAMTDEFEYLYVTPLEKMGDLDKNYFAPLVEQIGAEELGDLFDRMDKCYERHGNYTLILDEELSYMPDGISQTQEGMPYRAFYYYHCNAENVKPLAGVAKEIKEYYASQNAPLHYRIYRSGFGVVGNFFMVAVSAKDPAHLAMINRENTEKLGEKRVELLNKALQYTSKFEVKNAWMRDDLAYKPAVSEQTDVKPDAAPDSAPDPAKQ